MNGYTFPLSAHSVVSVHMRLHKHATCSPYSIEIGICLWSHCSTSRWILPLPVVVGILGILGELSPPGIRMAPTI
eukprot:7385101-Prymnesium_polylepis.1